MKNLLLIIFLMVGIFTSAQQQELIGNTWSFQKLILDDVEYFKPVNEEFPVNAHLSFYFDNESFIGESIVNGYSLENLTLNNDQVYFENFHHTFIECNINENNTFNQNLYSIFFNELDFNNFSPLHYTISREETYDLLVFTNSDGNQAHYISENLSLNGVISTDLNLKSYPNPVQEILTLKGLIQNKVNIKILDVSGKIVQQNHLNVQQDIVEISVSNLPKGVYFVQIFDDSGKVIYTQKVLKN